MAAEFMPWLPGRRRAHRKMPPKKQGAENAESSIGDSDSSRSPVFFVLRNSFRMRFSSDPRYWQFVVLTLASVAKGDRGPIEQSKR
ncbi:hypothetical protein L1887_63115 [Cichorium endivia]|nr:hypothetical protein L1887_63115 [Cichorium endivia]